MLAAVAQRDPAHRQVHKLLNGVLGFAGLTLVTLAITELITNWSETDKCNLLQEIALPVWMQPVGGTRCGHLRAMELESPRKLSAPGLLPGVHEFQHYLALVKVLWIIYRDCKVLLARKDRWCSTQLNIVCVETYSRYRHEAEVGDVELLVC